MLYRSSSRFGLRSGTSTITRSLWVAPFLAAVFCGSGLLAQDSVPRSTQTAVQTTSTDATTEVQPNIVITGDELPGAYGAPGEFSRSRFSPLTTAYVLPPGSVYAALIYEGDALRHGPPDHIFTQEVEVGLP